MTTVADIINLSLKDVGVIGDGQTASAEVMNDSFTTLQQMLGLWQADNLNVYSRQVLSLTPTGATSYTIGAGGNLNTVRPVSLTQVYYSLSGIDYEVGLLPSIESYNDITIKNIQSIPVAAYYEPTYPLGTLYIYPAPTTGTIKVVTSSILPVFTSIADVISISPEYLMAIRLSLDELLSWVFQSPLRPDIAANAAKARRVIRRNASRAQIMNLPASVTGGWYYNGIIV